MYSYFDEVLARLESQYEVMEQVFDPPAAIAVNTRRTSGFVFRHVERSDQLFCFLKGAKLISTMNGALVLLRQGYAQEVNALFRVVDDCCTDILFIIRALDGESFSDDQKQVIEDFYQEEFDDPSYPLGANVKRDSVPRRKILAGFGKLLKDELNASDAQSMMTTIHKAFSGYVHGAYPHIMEMYGGPRRIFTCLECSIRRKRRKVRCSSPLSCIERLWCRSLSQERWGSTRCGLTYGRCSRSMRPSWILLSSHEYRRQKEPGRMSEPKSDHPGPWQAPSRFFHAISRPSATAVALFRSV